MSRIRAVFLGTPDIARYCLEAMIKDPHFEVVAVVTQPDRPAGRKMQLQPSPVKRLAEPLGIPVFTPENVSDPSVLDQLRAVGAEVAVVVAYGQILKQKFLDLFPGKVVNVHASLLPRWRGAAPIQRALMNGDLESGVCLQVMVRKLDAGPVLGMRRIQLSADMSAEEFYNQCEVLGAQLIAVDLMDYLRGNLTPVPQDEAQVIYAPKIEKAEAEIDWSRDATAIHNQVRGLAMGPFAYTERVGRLLKIHRTRLGASVAVDGGQMNPTGSLSPRPGQVVAVAEKSLLVRCGRGSLELLEVQPESRAKMPVSEYLRGYPIQPGDFFGRDREKTN